MSPSTVFQESDTICSAFFSSGDFPLELAVVLNGLSLCPALEVLLCGPHVFLSYMLVLVAHFPQYHPEKQHVRTVFFLDLEC